VVASPRYNQRMSIEAEILARDCAVVRGLLPEPYALALGRDVDRALTRPADPALDVRALRNLARAASSIVELNWVELCEQVFTAPVRSACAALLDDGYRLSLQHSRIRRQTPPNGAMHAPFPWHQDAGSGYAPGRMLTIWITLTPCGENAPGLDFYRRPHTTQIWGGDHAEEALGALAAGDRYTFSAQPGDAIIFTGETLHRTQPSSPMMMLDRLSIDIRVMEANVTPANTIGSEFIDL
jgi:hypothetical protein